MFSLTQINFFFLSPLLIATQSLKGEERGEDAEIFGAPLTLTLPREGREGREDV
jgi:hypothetical protein